MELSRRAFIAAGAWLAGLLSLRPGRALAGPAKVAIPISKVPDLGKVGGFAVVALKGKQILLARTGEESVIGVDARCTHDHCVLFYDVKAGRIACGCHGSAFATNGAVLKGPAKTGLKAYPAALSGDRIVVDAGS